LINRYRANELRAWDIADYFFFTPLQARYPDTNVCGRRNASLSVMVRWVAFVVADLDRRGRCWIGG
jgi:hypothetical protein